MNQASMFDESGKVLRDLGIKKAVDHADKEVPNWSDMALAKVREFIAKYPHLEFMTEDVRVWAHRKGLPEAGSKRSWGGVMVRAKHSKLIVMVRIAQVKNPTAHCANANVWRKLQ